MQQLPNPSIRLDDGRRGAALVTSLILCAALAGLSMALAQASLTRSREQRTAENQMASELACEGVLERGYANVLAGGTGVIASPQNPLDWDGIDCWVTRTDFSGTVCELSAVARHSQAATGLRTVLEGQTDSFFKWAVFGDTNVHADSNAQIDSFDSEAGTYAAQAVNGSGANQHADTDGNIGSNQDVSVDQNAKIWGDAVPGPDASASVLGNAVVTGSTIPLKAPIDFPPITIPTYASSGALTVVGTVTKAAGNYKWTAALVKANAKLKLTGPSNIVMTSLTLKSGAQIEVDDTNGPVTFYVIDDLIMNSNTLVHAISNDPKSIAFNLNGNTIVDPDVLVDFDLFDFDSNSKFYGTIYAPNADINIDSNFELFGSLIAHSVDLDSNCKIHYDSSLGLLDSDGLLDWVQVCTYEVAAAGN